MRPGTKKGIIFGVLKTTGSAGMPLPQLLEAVKQHSDWTEAEGDKKIAHMVITLQDPLHTNSEHSSNVACLLLSRR